MKTILSWVKFWQWDWFQECALCADPIFFGKSGTLKVNTADGVIDKPLCGSCVNELIANPRQGFTPPKK